MLYSLHRYIVTSLHRYIVTSLHRYNLLIFNTPPAPRLISGGSKRANALYCFHLVSKKLKIQSSDNASYFRAEGEDFCGTLRLDPKNIPLPLFNFKLHLSTVSLIGNWVECASSIIKKSTLWVRTRFEHGFSLCNVACMFLFSHPLCVKSELVLNWFSHYSRTTLKNYINYLFYLFYRLSFLRQSSFLRQLSPLRQPSFLRLQLSFPRRQESTHVYCLKSLFLQRGLFALCRTAVRGFSRLGPSVGRSLHRQIILSDIKYHYLHPLLSLLRPLSLLRQLPFLRLQSSFPRRRESRKHLLGDEVHYVKFPFVFLLTQIKTLRRIYV